MAQETLNVLVLADFDDTNIERLKAVSPTLKITRKIVKSANEVPSELWATTDILYTGRILPEPDSVPRLRWVQISTAGVDHLLNHRIMNSQDIVITTASGIHATTMAEFTFALILALARKIPAMLRNQQKAEWPADKLTLYLPIELRGSTLGIVGYGNIGREIARIAHAFGMEVLATKRNIKHPQPVHKYIEAGTGDPDTSIVARLYPPEATRSMVSVCDFVVILLPLTTENKGFFNADILAAMKPTACLINVARGSVIDEEALITALQTDKIAGAGLDVYTQEPLPASSPLWKMENVIVSPHISGHMSRYNEAAAELFAQNLERYLNKQDLLNRVDSKLGY